MTRIRMNDITGLTALPSGYGHYRITLHSIDKAVDGASAVTSHMPDIDDYKSDDDRRSKRGYKALRNTVLREVFHV